MIPNMPMVQGRETLKMAFKGMFDSGVKEINLKIEDLIDTGDYVIERSSYTQKVQPPGMGEIEDVGKYMVVWKKTPDGYKVYWDIINSDLPPPPS
jgi:ketosteroid isomerase-like protein